MKIRTPEWWDKWDWFVATVIILAMAVGIAANI